MVRVLHLILALCIAAQALAYDSTLLVCRYTGKVVTPCACPDERRAEPDCATIRRQDCCEVHKSEAPAVPAVVKASAPTPVRHVLATGFTPAPSEPFLGWDRSVFVASRQQAPPSTPLYLSIRSLLI
jgi:hypothetical protein